MEEIVSGIDVFRETFATYADSFIVIGGYKFASRKNGDGDKRYVFYSFVEGKEGFPDQIELLSKPDESIGTPAFARRRAVQGGR